VTRVSRFDLFAVDLPFRSPFRHAAAVRATSGSLFLRVVLDDGVDGWGESLPRPYVSGENRETAFALLRDVILPALIGREFSSLAEVVAFLDVCDGKAPSEVVPSDVPQSSAWCCVDLALLDAIGRSTNEAVVLDGAARALGRPERVRFSGVASSGTGARQVVSLLKLRAFGFRHVKVKVDADGTLRSVRTARRILGRRTDIRVDANMAWNLDEASRTIAALRALGVGSVEQPIAPEDLDGLARLVRQTGVVIMADEGLTDRGSLQTLIARRACSGANIRISKCGGLVASHARCLESLDAGLTLQIGCQVGESSLLSAAQVNLLTALEHRDPGVRFAEGCFGRHLLRGDPVRPLVQFGFGGRPPPRPAGPGLGVTVDTGPLERFAVERTRILS
jgi:muconate cycloisomerase